MNIAVLTSLYPTHVRPHEGIFAERRWSRMHQRGHAVRVVQPLPFAPLAFLKPEWSEIARTARRETRAGIEIERPRYVHVPRCPRRNARAFAAAGMRAILRAGPPDVIVADYAWPAGMAAHAARRARVPLVISGRGSDVLQVAGEAGLGDELAGALRTAGRWCAVSEHLVDAMDRLAGQPGRGVLVPNGVDSELFRPRDREAARRAINVPPQNKLVLVVGHLIERKDPLLALRAFALAELGPDALIVFIGRGPLEAALLREFEHLDLRAQCGLCTEMAADRLATWYCAADVLLLTSRREGRPNVVLEALASGLQVLACDAGGTRELLVGLDGCLVDSRAPEQIAGALRERLAKPIDPALLRAHAEQFGWERGLEALEALLADALREPSRAQ